MGFLLIFNLIFFYGYSYADIIEKDSLYEYGVGSIAFKSPHYPGADQTRNQIFTFPYFSYRGKRFRIDDEGARNEILQLKDWKFDFSFAAAFPANSRDNRARKGMDNLDWIAEVGPRLRYFILPRKNDVHNLDLSFQWRAVYSTDFRFIVHRGEVFHPVLKYSYDGLFTPKLTFVVRLGAIWGSEKMADYFYEVKSSEATTQRPLYNAKAGLIENHVDIALLYQFSKKIRGFLGLQKNSYHQAANKNAYLLRKNQTESLALGVVWSIYQSEKKAYTEL